MKLCYLDCFSGISGDMLLGALVDAGLSPAALESELRKLNLKDWSLSTERVQRGGLTATKLDFKISETHHHRTWKKIRELIRASALAAPVQQRAELIFDRLAEAEAGVHGVAKNEVHFHEVGAMDSILDIVGASVAMEKLGIEKIVVSPLNLGSGSVETAHGTLPVPAPATAALLKNAPVYSTGVAAELVTPTGAAVVTALAAEYGPLPRMSVSAIGYGAGSRDLKEQANVLRVFLGERLEESRATDEPTVSIIEANLDDMSPQLGGYFMEQALAAGALDVFYTPVQMKKNRPGVLLTVICPSERVDALSEMVFQQTTTIGLRIYEARRRVLAREFVSVETPHGSVRMKVARLNGRVLNAAPEYDDCQRLAREKSVPLKQVLADAQFCFRQQHKDS
ncbi:MAG: nickel pincer cofactor biosynthesis protein LarC [Acidobacteria bacterium]|nr:nickel pincer cofactor biosynthesis protein LarC [Acidobacteriota bacterium]